MPQRTRKGSDQFADRYATLKDKCQEEKKKEKKKPRSKGRAIWKHKKAIAKKNCSVEEEMEEV